MAIGLRTTGALVCLLLAQAGLIICQTSATQDRVAGWRYTFSAAQIFIAQVNRHTRTVFAGEPSSSKPNFVGEENQIVLPWSGAIGSISNRYHESIPGDNRSWIEPEIKVELSSKDYFANRDPALEAILKRYQKQ
jgi:hypothetical protein